MKANKAELFSMANTLPVDFSKIDLFVMYGWATSGFLMEGTDMDTVLTITNEDRTESTYYHIGFTYFINFQIYK